MKETISIMLKGAAMGVAEVIPGVSGGTLAFITGIYERLLNAISHINIGLVKTLKREGFKAVLQKIDAMFLIKLLMGMAIGFVIGLKVIIKLLDSNPIMIWSLFFGLILASIPFVAKQVSKWGGVEIVFLVLGAALVYWVTIAAPSQGSSNLIIVFLAGIIGVSALMLPGLSGSFVLLLLGMYTIIMPALHDFLGNPFGPETGIVVAFALGMLVGLLTFAKVLTYTFKRFPNPTLALLTGFLIGSLNKVWPWQKVLELDPTKDGFKAVRFSESVLPGTFGQLADNPVYGNVPHILTAIIAMAVGILVVYGLDRMSVNK
ncbi:MAG: DUF368 domain-containing protein [Bacteroidetes bacterium]|nr:MAG: DUF368 domain-containing protein [Bacteroidota bacterium]